MMILDIALGLALAAQSTPPQRITLVLDPRPEAVNVEMDQQLAELMLARLEQQKELTPNQYRLLIALTIALGTRQIPLCPVAMARRDLERERWQRQPNSAQLVEPCKGVAQ